ncbi:MAG: pyridoxine 5'-phosphate synthase [Bacteroidia bacterium]|nr:pyridoxine 5'-phosphate synthase [Bacteroidia bacterium]
MVQLSVNLNKVALIRNSRGHDYPNLLKVAQDCVSFGADGITVHPRPDERHTRYSDIQVLKDNLDVELNVEGYPSESFLNMIEETRPAQCTLVPDAPDAITSNAGWDTIKHEAYLKDIISRISSWGVRTSIFIETHHALIEKAKEIGTDRIELYTEEYARQFAAGNKQAVEPYASSAALAHSLGLGVNAGHDLNLDNLAWLAESLPSLDEVSIGHALVTDALYLGLRETIRRYQTCLGKTESNFLPKGG